MSSIVRGEAANGRSAIQFVVFKCANWLLSKALAPPLRIAKGPACTEAHDKPLWHTVEINRQSRNRHSWRGAFGAPEPMLADLARLSPDPRQVLGNEVFCSPASAFNSEKHSARRCVPECLHLFAHVNKIGTNILRVKFACGNLAMEIPMNKQQTNPDIDQYEAATEEAIEACGGDARAAVKALLIVNAFLEDELALAKMAVSYGYSKGWHARKRDV